MDKLVIASSRRSAGKTSVAVGLAKALGKKAGYAKPFGDRLIYREKHTWDYDAALVSRLLGLPENPEELTMGFQHSKLKYMYDEPGTAEKVKAIAEAAGRGRELVIIECGRDFSYGASVHLDALSLARYVEGRLILVISGAEEAVMDDICFYQKHFAANKVDFAGVIINKVHDPEDFKTSHLGPLSETGVKVLGVLPFARELTWYSARYLADSLTAKVIAGEDGLDNTVKNVFVGAMSADDAARSAGFKREGKVVISSGDRSDLVLAALESGSAAVVLANNIRPPSNITSIASSRRIPLLLVSADAYQAAAQVWALEPLTTPEDSGKISLLESMIKTQVTLSEII